MCGPSGSGLLHLNSGQIAMLRTNAVSLALLCVLLVVAPATATEYFDLGMHGRVQVSDIVVLARVVDPVLALMNVERVLKGEAPKQIRLVAYVDGFAVPAQRKPLIAGARELLFLTKKGDAYAPVQDQNGRMAVNGDRLIDSFRAEPRSLPQTVASIQRLVSLQARAARGDAEADAAYVAALKNSDSELQMWALWKAKDHIKVPSPALADALLASWPTVKEVGPVLGAWNAAGLVANAVVTWRLQRAAPFFAKILTTSGSGDERAWAAMALGGSGDRAYLPVLRRVAAEDAHGQARELAYNGIMYMLGPDSLGDLRLEAKDSDDKVRARAVVDSYNLLEFGNPEPRWPPPSNALIAEVRTFLTEMQRDPARLVSDNAKSMLAMIARQRP
jgi:HEAT repeats